ncbi:MAG: hypothetical protein WBC05_05205 [Sedimentisphaerales bacterium]
MSLKFLIKSFERRFLPGILALIFLLAMVLSDVTLSQESQAGKEEVLRKASLRWMQLGMQQYRSDLFTEAELSFRRAHVFKKYLTDAERQQLNEFLANARIAISEGKQALADTQTADESVEPNQPVKAEVNVEKVKDSEPSTEQGRQQTGNEIKTISVQPSQREVQPVKVTEPSVSKIQFEAESSSGVVLVKNKSFGSKYMRLSAWLSQNRRNVLMIGLPALAVLVFISKLQGRRKRPGRSVYTNHVPASTSYIGNRLNRNKENSRAVVDSKNGRLAFAAAGNPKRKSFEQSTEHWKEKHAGHTPGAGKSFQISKKWPQRKDKFEDDGPVIAKAEQKLCSKCEELKAHSDFHKDKSCKDGLARWCKECKKQYRKKSV